jgi:hypothetical protein
MKPGTPLHIAVFFLFLGVIGAMYLVVGYVWKLAIGGTVPDYSVGKWVLLAFTFGIASAVGELLFYPRVMAPDKVTDPLWKRGTRLGAALLFTALFCVIVVAVERL